MASARQPCNQTTSGTRVGRPQPAYKFGRFVRLKRSSRVGCGTCTPSRGTPTPRMAVATTELRNAVAQLRPGFGWGASRLGKPCRGEGEPVG